KKHNGNLPGMGGAFNPVNLAVYHYGGNNPIKYVDPNGRENILEMFIRWAMGRPHSGLWQQNPRMAMMELQMGRSIIKLSHAITANVETRIALNGSITLLTGKIIITQSHDKMSIGVRGGLNIPKLGPIVGKVIEVGFDFILHDDDKLSFEFSDIKHGVDINIPQGGLVTGTIQGRINNEGEVELRFLEKVGIADNPVASANLEVGVNIKASKLLEELGKKDY
ncbi:MAG: hypothetical protein JXB49_06295, partial [Bacteroidales bacterium]|nr:hypothetical protein [Bacteroidales bacterium]